MKILHLEDNAPDAALVHDVLLSEWPDCFISVVATREDFITHLRLGGHELILSDYRLPGFTGMDALQLARELAPDVPFVFFSGTIGEDSAIEAVRAGAADYVLKDRIQRLPIAIRRALRESAERGSHRRMEQALAQEQYLQQLMMENLPDRVYFKDLHSAFLAVSRSLAERVGLAPGQMKGKSDFDLFSPEHAHKAFADEQRIIRTGEPLLNIEERETWPDGSVTWVSTSKLPLRDAAGAIIGTFGISRDITASKRDEERLREQAEVINQAPLAILITDLNHRITYGNEGAAQLYGVRRDELAGRRSEDFLISTSADRLLAACDATALTGHWTGVIPLSTRTGRTVQAEFHLSLIADAAGQPRARLCIAIDVTERKKLEEQFLRAQRLESLGLLAAGIAHDLNNVLAPILMGAPLLQSHSMAPTERRVLEAIESSAARGAALVRQILSFAQGAGGGQVLVQTKHLLQDMMRLLQQTLPKNVRLEQDIPNDLWPVQGNPTQLHQVVLNLCVNARDAMPEGGHLRLVARNETIAAPTEALPPEARPGAFLVIEVADSGTGIPPDILARIWEPFFTTKGEGKGTGLGLATVRGIIANHNGFVAVESALGQGTTFRVFLPAVAENTTTRAARTTAAPFEGRGQGELVLVVDDEASIRDLITAILSRSGYRVLTAPGGSEAMELFQSRPSEIGLVITDLGMPEMDGARLARELRELQPGVKLLFMSGANVAGGKDAAPAGAAVLQKPFAVDALLAAVRAGLATST
jgi:two-component system cell cycle sensor histidine kinase/response regulator CckA